MQVSYRIIVSTSRCLDCSLILDNVLTDLRDQQTQKQKSGPMPASQSNVRFGPVTQP
jgi:hypothetical protein